MILQDFYGKLKSIDNNILNIIKDITINNDNICPQIVFIFKFPLYKNVGEFAKISKYFIIFNLVFPIFIR